MYYNKEEEPKKIQLRKRDQYIEVFVNLLAIGMLLAFMAKVIFL